MFFRRLTACVLLILALAITGCGGGNDPVNEGKDKPKKDK